VEGEPSGITNENKGVYVNSGTLDFQTKKPNKVGVDMGGWMDPNIISLLKVWFI
jgi:hypothetical protein